MRVSMLTDGLLAVRYIYDMVGTEGPCGMVESVANQHRAESDVEITFVRPPGVIRITT